MKIAYVVDAAGTNENIERIIALVQGASILYIETPFLHEDVELAEHRRHLTARQAGEIARAARVDRLVTLHFSPRYELRAEALIQESQIAFRGVEDGRD
jgi:ribonuclease Z